MFTKRLLIFLALVFLAMPFVWADSYIYTQRIYDNITDSSVNQTLWSNVTSGDVVSINAIAFPNYNRTTNITVYLNLSADRTAFCYSGSSSFSAFGSTVNSVSMTGSCSGTNVDTSQYLLVRNGTLQNGYNFLIYNDGVLTGTISPNQNNISFLATVTGSTSRSLTEDTEKITGEVSLNAGGTAQAKFELHNVTYFDVDSLEVTLNSPENGYTTTEPINNFNVSIGSFPSNITNATLYVWYSNNSIFTTNLTQLNGSTNLTVNTVNFTTIDGYKWNYYACSQSQCTWANSNRTFIYGYRINNITYNSSTYDTAQESFILNITTASGTSSTADFYYNGAYVSSTAGTSDGTNKIFTSTKTIPSGISSAQFYWSLAITDSVGNVSYYNSTTSNQSISSLAVVNVSSGACSAGFQRALYFEMADEPTRTIMNANVSYNFQYGLAGNLTGLLSYGSFNNINNFSLCINSTLPTYTIGYGEIEYTANAYTPRRFYVFPGTRLTNQTINNTLYLLADTESTSFEFTVADNLYQPLVGGYLSLLRWYPSINEYKVVQISKTDSDGKTVGNVVVENVDYRVAVYNSDGELQNLFQPIRFVCTTSPCEYSVFLPASAGTYYNLDNFQQSLTFNSTSKIFTYIWNDQSQASQTINLTVYRDTSSGSTIVCTNTASSFTGILTCSIASYTSGNFRAQVSRTASPLTIINQIITRLGDSFTDIPEGRTMGLFMSFIFFVFGFFAGLFNPILAIILGIVALIPAIFVGAIPYSVFIGLILLGWITIHWMRRSTSG